MRVYLQLIILLFLSKIAHAATVYVDVNGSNPTPPYSSLSSSNWTSASEVVEYNVTATNNVQFFRFNVE